MAKGSDTATVVAILLSGFAFYLIFSIVIPIFPPITPLIVEQTLQKEVQGVGKWDKNELKFYIESNGISDDRVQEVRTQFTETRGFLIGYFGWQGALDAINKIYPENNVPDRLVETDKKYLADIIVMMLHEDDDENAGLASNHIKFPEMVIVKSVISLYNADERPVGQLGAVAKHEAGHSIGLEHNTRHGDIMNENLKLSIIPIKRQNINDLYAKYQD